MDHIAPDFPARCGKWRSDMSPFPTACVAGGCFWLVADIGYCTAHFGLPQRAFWSELSRSANRFDGTIATCPRFFVRDIELTVAESCYERDHLPDRTYRSDYGHSVVPWSALAIRTGGAHGGC